jgi:hypothetical protein
MAQASPMLRLLQGDVGSGKTLVALVAMLTAVEAGAQAALLAPTEILARQHFALLGQTLDVARRAVKPRGLLASLEIRYAGFAGGVIASELGRTGDDGRRETGHRTYSASACRETSSAPF